MKVVFTRGRSLFTVTVRTVSWSAWSHVSLVTNEDTIIEAAAFHGVVERPLSELIAESSKFEFVDIPCPNDQAGIAWARTQLGKPYDYFGALGIGFHREWNADTHWWCSELVEAAILEAGRQRFRSAMKRLTPQHVYMVNS